MTVEEVLPNSLSQAFGTGVRLGRITAEITEEPITSNVRNLLSWIGEGPEQRLDPNFRMSTNPTLSQRLSHGDFLKAS